MKAKLSKHSKTDLLDGIDWFDGISVGLGDKFEAEFYFAFERVKANSRIANSNRMNRSGQSSYLASSVFAVATRLCVA